MNYKSRILVFCLVILMLVPILPERTYAQSGVGAIPTLDQGLNLKEVGIPILGFVVPGLTLDSLMIIVVKAVMEKILDSTVEWINSGFEGNPAFVTDPKQFYSDIADRVAGEFIEGSDLGFLCSPFQSQIILSLRKNQRRQQQFQCTLTDVVDNIDAFYNDFSEGGWDGWLSMTQNSSNNPYDAYLDAQIELDSRVMEALGLQKEQLSFSSGVLNWSECVQTNPDTGECIKRGPTKTPGVVIESQLENVLGTGVRQLELADEFDEVVGALINQLLTKFVFGSEGLLGGGGGGGGGGGSGGGGSVIPTSLPTVTFSVSDASIAYGGASTLTWSTTNATYCEATGDWSGERTLSGSQSTGILTADQTYTLACANARGPALRTVTVTIAASTIPRLTFAAVPNVINSGESTTLNWSTRNADYCEATGGWSGSKDPNGGPV